MTETEHFDAVKAAWDGLLVDAKLLAPHGVVGLHKFLYTWAILADVTVDGYADRWCYHDYEAAKAGLDAWDGTGEPQGWHRHPPSGRRRDPDGRAYVMR